MNKTACFLGGILVGAIGLCATALLHDKYTKRGRQDYDWSSDREAAPDENANTEKMNAEHIDSENVAAELNNAEAVTA